jgi:hypothetical protein
MMGALAAATMGLAAAADSSGARAQTNKAEPPQKPRRRIATNHPELYDLRVQANAERQAFNAKVEAKKRAKKQAKIGQPRGGK